MRYTPPIRSALLGISVATAALLTGFMASGATAATHANAQHPVGQHPASPQPRLPRASCGSAATNRLDANTQLFSADPGALHCFRTAARRCSSASIEVTERQIDTGTHHVFRIEPGWRPCQVAELSQFYMVPSRGRTFPTNFTSCVVTAVTGAGVRLNCGGRDVLIPATV